MPSKMHKSVLTGPNILSCLINVSVTVAHAELLGIDTERIMPIPTKITFEVESIRYSQLRM
jgi:hypothetical protein